VAVEDEHQIGLQHVEDLRAKSVEAAVERALVPVVQFTTKIVGKHNGRTCASSPAPTISPWVVPL